MSRLKFISYLLVICLISGCSSFSKQNVFDKYTESRVLLGTIIRFDICFSKERKDSVEKSAQKAWERIEDINTRMNVYNKESEVYKINTSEGKPFSISKDTYELLKDSVKYSEMTKGAFDITVYPIIDLWKEAGRLNRVPSPEDIKSTLKHTGSDKIRFLGSNTVQVLDNKTQIDLGGIAKGYAVDEAASILKKEGFDNFLIDAGGDIYASGCNCVQRPWKIGIKHPRIERKIFHIVKVENASVTTSGDYEKYYDIQGIKYSHIIDPRTGYPQKGVASATVIAPNAKEADAFSTALSVLGGENGIRFIDEMNNDDIAAIVIEITPAGEEIFKSSNYEKVKIR